MESIKEFPRGIKSDQAISFGTASTDDAGVRPGPGQVSSAKRQAAGDKRQASSFKRQAKRQATSAECDPNRQAPSKAFRDDRSGDRGSRSSHKVLLVQKRLPGL